MPVPLIPKTFDPMRDVLSNRLFRHLWISQIASQIASNILIFLLALLIYRKTGSNVAVSGLFVSYGLPSLLFGVVAGTIVDQLDRRAVLIVAHITRVLLVIAMLLLGERLVVLYLLMFVFAIINQMTVPSEAPLIPKFVAKDRLVSANSLFSFTFYGSVAIGLIAAGPVLRILGREGAYMLLCVLFVIATCFVILLPPQGEGVKSLRRIFSYDPWYIVKRFFSNMEMGVQYVIGNRTLRDAVMMLTSTQITLVLLGTLGPGFADTVLHIDVRDASLLVVGPTIIGILVGALWLGKRGTLLNPQILIRRGILLAGIILVGSSALFAAANTIWFTQIPRSVVLSCAIGLFFVLGVANSFLDVPSNTILQRETEGDMRGRVYGILSASVGGAGILPVVISGVLADTIGVGNVILLLGIVVLYVGVRRFTLGRSI